MKRMLVGLAVLVSLATSGAASGAKTHLCMKRVYGGDVVQVKHVSCKRARRMVRTWARRYKRDGIVTRHVLGFRCRDRSDLFGGAEGLVVRCKRHRGVITFYAKRAIEAGASALHLPVDLDPVPRLKLAVYA